MARIPEGCKLVLDPQADYNHVPDDASNYNESMYFSIFDADRGLGGWFRIGNRVNEGYAEMTNCLYLPDGRVGFMARRPKISSNEQMDAGGMRFEVVEPFRELRVEYEGKVCLLEDPSQMAEPSHAFRNNPHAPCRVSLSFTSDSGVLGGQVVRDDGSELPLDPEKGFAKAHYEQFMAGVGEIEVDGERFEVAGHGLRDKSWGPRYWQSIDWYRWIHARFSEDLAIGATVMSDGVNQRGGGAVYRGDEVMDIVDASVATEWDEDNYQKSLVLEVTTEAGDEWVLRGQIASLIPLRNRRALDDGRLLMTRITEGMTEFECDGKRTLGMSEYLDQIVDGRPLGRDS
ncbi:hypothetical protein MK489_23545 [Myxococcota bacterium]|nr:hypothetical protein [Myxococcota bacterium]